MRTRLAHLGLVAGVALGSLLLFLAVLDEFVMPRLVANPRVRVPQLRGMSAVQARTGLERWGLWLTVKDSVYHESLVAGTIVEQDPPPGQQIRKGRRISVSVSKGRRYYAVPEVRGKSLRDAQLQLESGQLVLGEVIYVSSDRYAAGAVVRATPSPGTRLPRGTLIDLEISSGPSSTPKPVPNLVGLAIEQVEDTLRKYEMAPGRIANQLDNEHPVGTVLSQSPAAGEGVLPKSPVDLVVSVRQDTPPAAERPVRAGEDTP